MNNKEIIKQVFREVFETRNFNESKIVELFHENYTQHVDGKKLSLQDFIAHIKKLKEELSSVKIIFDHIVCEDDSVCTVHRALGVKKSGVEVHAKVIAYFKLKDGKVLLCDELTHMVKGEEEDRDLGSRL